MPQEIDPLVPQFLAVLVVRKLDRVFAHVVGGIDGSVVERSEVIRDCREDRRWERNARFSLGAEQLRVNLQGEPFGNGIRSLGSPPPSLLAVLFFKQPDQE